MVALDELLQQFQQAQQDIYGYFGVSRQMQGGAETKVGTLRHKHIGGNEDIPTAYPEILDYRSRKWRQTWGRSSSDDEIHIKIQNDKEWEPENTVRFNILTIWMDKEANAICAVCNHLPKPDELYFAHFAAVERLRRGGNFYGDSCLLILSPKAKPGK